MQPADRRTRRAGCPPRWEEMCPSSVCLWITAVILGGGPKTLILSQNTLARIIRGEEFPYCLNLSAMTVQKQNPSYSCNVLGEGSFPAGSCAWPAAFKLPHPPPPPTHTRRLSPVLLKFLEKSLPTCAHFYVSAVRGLSLRNVSNPRGTDTRLPRGQRGEVRLRPAAGCPGKRGRGGGRPGPNAEEAGFPARPLPRSVRH